jgi:hypothetical protein
MLPARSSVAFDEKKVFFVIKMLLSWDTHVMFLDCHLNWAFSFHVFHMLIYE